MAQTLTTQLTTTMLSKTDNIRINNVNLSSVINSTSKSRTTLSESTSGIRLSSLSNEPKAVSGKVIGLSIGLPVGIFCLGIGLFLIYFYFIKNSILISNPPISPSDSVITKKNNWFSNLFNIDGYGHSHNDIERNCKESIIWPSDNAIESKIQYNIGTRSRNNRTHHHVLTPKYAYTQPSKNETDNIDTYLYSKPPNIYPIGTSLSSPSNIKSEIINKDGRVPQYNKDADRKWEYTSPLSKWFLRSSLYLKDNAMNTTTSLNDIASRLTPTVQLKHLNILNRVNKNYTNDPSIYEDERSPILPKPYHEESGINEEDDSHDSIVRSLLLPTSSHHSNTSGEGRIQNRHSFIYDSIGAQVLEDNHPKERDDISILSVPEKKRSKKKKKHMLDAINYEKELPLTPHSALKKDNRDNKEKEDDIIKVGRVCQVRIPYSPRLTDEIGLEIGEYVRVLVTHNDGWCLVEKCTMDGTSKSLIYSGLPTKDKKYLNDDRGIIPGECLEGK